MTSPDLFSPPIRLAALDMDGTLLDSRKRILPETVEDLRRAASRGMQLALCTGRGLAEILPYRRQLTSVRWAILLNGAHLYDLTADRTAEYRTLRPQDAEAILAAAERHDAMPHALTDRASIVPRARMDHMEDYHIGVFRPLYERVASPVADMQEALRRGGMPGKMLIYFRSEADCRAGAKELAFLPVTLSLSTETALEITPPGADKGTALRELAQRLGLPMNETAAVGDSYNDEPMLRAAGRPVVMGNASDAIRASAYAVTADNDHNGAGLAIRSLLGEAELPFRKGDDPE